MLTVVKKCGSDVFTDSAAEVRSVSVDSFGVIGPSSVARAQNTWLWMQLKHVMFSFECISYTMC